MKKDASMTSSGWCTFVLPTCSKMSPGFAPESAAGVPGMISVNCAVDPSTAAGACATFDTNPAMARFTEAHEIAVNLFRGVDRQRVAGGTVVHAADENADHLAFEVEQRRAGFTALRL